MTKNMVTAIFSTAIGAVYLCMTLRLPRPALGDRIGPRLFPILIAVCIMLCGLLLLLVDFRSKIKDHIRIDFKTNREVYLKIAATIVLGILYGMIIETAGYVISSFLFVFLIMLIINNFSKLMENLLVSLGFSIISFVVFFTVLHLSLPRGWLAF
jgi:putative tricarboxylic transport membrane protein